MLCLLSILAVTVIGCGRVQREEAATPQDGFDVTLMTEPSPPVVGDGVVIVTLRDPQGQPIDGAQLEVEGNMSHAGMVPVAGRPEGSRDGIYRVSMHWSMGGDWFVDVKFTLRDGQVVERRFPVVVEAG